MSFVLASTVYVVDDDKFFLDVISQFLRRSGFLVESYLSAAELLSDLSAEAKGCILADLQMPEMDGLKLQNTLRQHPSSLPIVFLTGSGNIPASVEAIKHGAEDFLTKEAPNENIISAVNRAIERNEEERAAKKRADEIQNKLGLLTEREREVLGEVVKGKLNKQIADQLGIHERTVKLHRTSITTKLGMPSVAELTKFWIEAGFDPSI